MEVNYDWDYLFTKRYTIGAGTKIWQPRLTNILPGAKIGHSCTVGAYTEIGKDVKIGNNCKIQYGVFIPKGVRIGNEVFIGPNVTFTNDRYPGSDDWGLFERTVVQDGVSIGAGSVIRCGVTLKKGCRIGAGSVVTKNIPEGELWYGNPARRQDA